MNKTTIYKRFSTALEIQIQQLPTVEDDKVFILVLWALRWLRKPTGSGTWDKA